MALVRRRRNLLKSHRKDDAVSDSVATLNKNQDLLMLFVISRNFCYLYTAYEYSIQPIYVQEVILLLYVFWGEIQLY